MTKVLMVCLANICRSPMARVVAQTIAGAEQRRSNGFKAMFRRGAFEFHSAGIRAPLWSEGTDMRAQAVLQQRGYAVSKTRSRRVNAKDFEHFDLIVAMDHTVLTELRRLCPPAHTSKLHLLLDFSPDHRGQDVPDPYYGNLQGFDRVLDLCELGARALIKAIYAQNLNP